MRVLLTGAAGFIGHHVLSYLISHTPWEIVGLVKMDKIGDMKRITDECGMCRDVKFVWHDLRSPIPRRLGLFDYILHFAAETHVDRSIEDPMSFVQSNVVGTTNVLEYAKRWLKDGGKFLYFSTDEVFGPAPALFEFGIHDAHNPNNPYAATKSAAEQMVKAYINTYALPGMIVRGMNVFGERQHPEKFIPKTIRMVRDGEVVKVHAGKGRVTDDGVAKVTELIPGSRFYIYAKDVADAVLYALRLESKEKFPTYHVVGEREVSNLDLVYRIADLVGREAKYELVDFHSSRPGHDLRYAIAEHLPGWNRPSSFDLRLRETVAWYLSNPEWLDG